MGPDLRTVVGADGVRLAWSAVGTGPTLLHLPGVPFSDLEAEWRIPPLTRAYERLARHTRLIQFDGRGTGRSQRDVTSLTPDAFVGDIDAVADAAGGGPLVVLGFYHSVLHAIAWAARHPERVRAMILFGGALRGWDLMRGPGTQALLSLIERDWDTFVESAAHAWLGWPEGDEGRMAADWFRTSTSPLVARATLESARETDVTDDAGRVTCPVLVLHRRDAQVIPLRLSETLAAAFPDGRLEVIPGHSATLYMEATDAVADLIARFAVDPSAPLAPSARGAPRATSAAPGAGRAPTAGGLSPRELDVVRLLAAGETNGQIAATLGLSINTVERHVSNLYRKIDVRGRAEATAWAIHAGLA
jgi:pimeloyl-ACP methyl ester carboxylesterase/DNA-binding CsgD family transcriptional regulator